MVLSRNYQDHCTGAEGNELRRGLGNGPGGPKSIFRVKAVVSVTARGRKATGNSATCLFSPPPSLS